MTLNMQVQFALGILPMNFKLALPLCARPEWEVNPKLQRERQ